MEENERTGETQITLRSAIEQGIIKNNQIVHLLEPVTREVKPYKISFSGYQDDLRVNFQSLYNRVWMFEYHVTHRDFYYNTLVEIVVRSY